MHFFSLVFLFSVDFLVLNMDDNTECLYFCTIMYKKHFTVREATFSTTCTWLSYARLTDRSFKFSTNNQLPVALASLARIKEGTHRLRACLGQSCVAVGLAVAAEEEEEPLNTTNHSPLFQHFAARFSAQCSSTK